MAVLLRHWGVRDQDVLDSAAIVVSELVTNVLVHCDDGGPVVLTLDLQDDQLRIGVEDCTSAVPTQRDAGSGDESGRGLGIVAQLAARWEVQPLPHGKRVVVDLPLPAAWCA